MPLTAAPPKPPPRSGDAQDPAERLDEAASLLALGFLRLAGRQNASLSRDFGDFPLDFAGQASVHGAEGEAP